MPVPCRNAVVAELPQHVQSDFLDVLPDKDAVIIIDSFDRFKISIRTTLQTYQESLEAHIRTLQIQVQELSARLDGVLPTYDTSPSGIDSLNSQFFLSRARFNSGTEYDCDGVLHTLQQTSNSESNSSQNDDCREQASKTSADAEKNSGIKFFRLSNAASPYSKSSEALVVKTKSELGRLRTRWSMQNPLSRNLTFLTKAVKSSAFDIVCGVLIIANITLIAIETEHVSRHHGESTFTFEITHLVFNCWFLLELFARILAEGQDFFCGGNWVANSMDTILVLSSAVEVLFESVLHGFDRFVRLYRVIRLVRVIRLARSLRYIHTLRKLLYALKASLMTLFWSFVMMFIVVSSFAIAFTQAVAERGRREDSASSGQLHEMYGNLSSSFYTLYQAATGGISWGEPGEPLVELHWMYTALYVFYISVTYFGLLNVVTAIFVESAMAATQHYKELMLADKECKKKNSMSHLKHVFNQIDRDGDGAISMEEVRVFLSDETAARTYLEALNVSPEDACVLFRLLDRDGSGSISLSEFSDGCLRLQGDAKSFELHCIMYDFANFLEKWSAFAIHLEKEIKSLGVCVRGASSRLTFSS